MKFPLTGAMPRRSFAFVVAGVLAHVLTGCTPSPAAAPPAPLAVYAATAAWTEDETHLTLIGEVRARIETPMAFRVPGKLIDRRVEVGDRVQRGDLLARIDPQDMALQMQATDAQRAAVRAELAQQQADLARFHGLLLQGFISEAEYERRRSTVDVTRSRLAEVDSAQRNSRNQLDYTVLRADEAGIVTAVDAERGQVLASGQPVLRIARADAKEVAVSVAEQRLQALQQARQLVVTFSALPGQAYRGLLREVSPVADPATRAYAARIALTGTDDEPVRLGMTARVAVHGERRRTLSLPLSALHRSGENTAVWTVDPANSRVSLVEVRVDAVRSDQVVIAEGLQPGALVVTAGVQKLSSGQQVRVITP